jgi:hypothetical protein
VSPQARRRRRWPTVEEQLAEHRVPAGSALERLVRENQELEMLHPTEVEDDFPFPPWFRVYVRKGHPEADFPPKAAYPLLFERVLEWMVSHPDAPTGRAQAPLLQGGRQKRQKRG